MKKFILNIVLVCLVATIILSCITLWNATKIQRIKFNIPIEIHSIVMGPSTTGCAINDSKTPGIKNLSKDGVVLLTLPLIPRILKNNPHIDTVYINYGRYYMSYTQKKHIDTSDRVRYLLPYYLLNNNYLYGPEFDLGIFFHVLITPNLHNLIFNSKKEEYFEGFGYTRNERYNLYNQKANWGIEWYNKHFRNNKKPTNTDGDSIIIQAINACKEKGVVPVLLFTPLYQYDRWVSKSILVDKLKRLDNSILVADYEDFQFPSDSFYADVHHLNNRGADYFSEYISSNGLKSITIEEWLSKIE